MLRVLPMVLLLCVPALAAAGSPDAAETRALLERLIAVDTTNPPGNEAAAAAVVVKALEGTSATVKTLASGEGRANLLVRLPATVETERAPLVLVAHLDVVGADPEAWQSPPLQLTERDGYLYGRGVIDDKGMVAASVEALRWLERRGAPRHREVVLLFTSDEEGGGGSGTHWLIEHGHLPKDAAFAVNEGGDVRLVDGKVALIGIQVTEKRFRNVKLVARGPGGHSSQPLEDNAIVRLARALERVGKLKLPVRLTPVTRRTLAGRARIETGQRKRDLLAVSRAGKRLPPAALRRLTADPALNAALRTTCVPTLLAGGTRSNALPQEASATVNCRVHPDDTWEDVRARLVRAIDDPRVELVASERPLDKPESPAEGPGWELLVEAAGAVWPDAVVVPFMSAGATDSANFRRQGVNSYGLLPFPLSDEDDRRMHGVDERMPVESLGEGLAFLAKLLELATAP